MKRTALLMGLFLVVSIILAACGGAKATETEEIIDVPAPYAGKTNPHSGDAASATAGQVIYDTNCASCHGAGGAGDGVAGTALTPKPADLRDIPEGDDFIFWRVSEGGAMEPFNSSMPAWKGVLSEDEIWQVVTYIRTLK